VIQIGLPEHRVRTLYAYEGDKPGDLCKCCVYLSKKLTVNLYIAFGENLILKAHPSKSGTDWWYGTLIRDGKSGFFPRTYVQIVEHGTSHPCGLST
jgi:hypothetical protein